jgi:hypothetical protein
VVVVGASLAYAVLKDGFNWLRRQAGRPRHWWRKRKFVEKSWEPTLNMVNSGTESTFAPKILSSRPDIKIRDKGEASQFSRFGKKLTVFVSEEEMKRKELENDSLIGLVKHIVKARTAPFRPYLPPQLKQANDHVATESIIWELRPGALDELGEIPLEETGSNGLTCLDKVEQMMFAGEYVDFCHQVLKTHQGQVPTTRIRKQVTESFQREFKELQKSFRGVLVKLSKSRVSIHLKGLLSLPISSRIPAVSGCTDWHLFVWIYPDGVVATGPIEHIAQGQFEELWNVYRGGHFKVEGMTQDEVYSQVSNWVKGLGGKRVKHEKSLRGTGSAVPVSLVLLQGFSELETPIQKDEFKRLTRARFTDLCRLTQKQVVALLERGL